LPSAKAVGDSAGEGDAAFSAGEGDAAFSAGEGDSDGDPAGAERKRWQDRLLKRARENLVVIAPSVWKK